MPIWTIAKKELRLLIRDPRAAIVLLAMPFLFILVLGLSLGEGFGQKPDDRLRVSIVDLDQGFVAPATTIKEAMGFFAWTPSLPETGGAVDVHQLAGLALASASRAARFPQETWAKVVQRDMTDSNIRVEIVSTEAEAEALIKQSKRSAILVFGPDFSKRVHECSFLATPEPPPGLAAEFNPIYRNPFYRDGVMLKELDARLLVDNTQVAAASIIEQVAQVSLLRVILPWMIGRAFEKLGEPSFMSLLAEEVPGGKLLPASVKTALGSGVQGALKKLFPKYNLTEKTWAGLTKSQPRTDGGAETTVYVSEGLGLPHRGAIRYQILVPSYTVMFAFFLVLTVGWLFVSERRQGTIKRLRAAPLHNSQIVLGKLLPVYLISVGQGLFLLAAGKLVFGMRWGPETWAIGRQILWLMPVVLSTSLAAMGLALLIASLARTETQVAIYGTPLVLVLAGISGCLMPRDLMPQIMKDVSLATPHAWALEAYLQLLINPSPDLLRVEHACLVLVGFGAAFLGLAWAMLKLD